MPLNFDDGGDIFGPEGFDDDGIPPNDPPPIDELFDSMLEGDATDSRKLVNESHRFLSVGLDFYEKLKGMV